MNRDSILARGKTFSLFYFPQHSYLLWAHPASYQMVTEDSLPGGKAAGPKAAHSPPYSSEVKNVWRFPPTLLSDFMTWRLINQSITETTLGTLFI
jgi:hypothetical protein